MQMQGLLLLACLLLASPWVAETVEAVDGLASVPSETRCLARPGGAACREEEVESEEIAMTEALNVEMLQLDVRMQARTVAPQHKPAEAFPPAANNRATPALMPATEQALLKRLEEEDRSIAALQQAVLTQNATIQELLSERHHQEASLVAEGSDAEGVDCGQYPQFCDPRINCKDKPATAAETAAIMKSIATPDGHVNLRSWCVAYPMYATSLKQCVLQGDLDGYAKSMLEAQTQKKLVEADAIYCFVSGHCNETDVTAHTTQADAERLCDKRFGHEHWTKVGLDDFKAVLSRASQWGNGQGLPKEWKYTDWASIVRLARKEARTSTMTACAMGNYHCDMVYCKQNFCHNPVHRAKWGNLSWVYN